MLESKANNTVENPYGKYFHVSYFKRNCIHKVFFGLVCMWNIDYVKSNVGKFICFISR